MLIDVGCILPGALHFLYVKKEVVDISHKTGSPKISYRAMMGSQKLDAFFNAINANAPAPEKKKKEE